MDRLDSYYCCSHDDPIQSAYFTDGYHFGGPFRVSGSVILTSSTPGRNNDPCFYSFTLSSDYCIYGQSSSGPHVTVPQYDKLWIEPYEMMKQGPPWYPEYEISGVEEVAEPGELILNASCNPVSSCVTITSSEQSTKRVFNSSGRLVDSSETAKHWVWNTTSLPAGVHLITAQGESDQTSSKRLVKL